MFKNKKDEQLPFMYFYDIQDKKDDEFEQISYSSTPVIESSSPPVIPPIIPLVNESPSVDESTSVIPPVIESSPVTPPITESPTPEIGPFSQISENNNF